MVCVHCIIFVSVISGTQSSVPVYVLALQSSFLEKCRMRHVMYSDKLAEEIRCVRDEMKMLTRSLLIPYVRMYMSRKSDG